MRILLLSLLIGTLTSLNLAQSKECKNLGVSSTEILDLRTIAKDFTQEYLQTRDLGPLLSKYFKKDFAVLLDDDGKDHSAHFMPMPSDRVRAFVTEMNMIYIMQVLTSMKTTKAGPDDTILDPLLSNRSKAKYHKLYPTLDYEPNPPKTLAEYRAAHLQMEQMFAEARSTIIRKRLDRSKPFLTQYQKYEKSDWLGYCVEVHENIEGISSRGPSPKTIVPRGTKTFSVTTPLWFVPEFARVGNRYKIVRLSMYDD